jgi:hypothetical protein
MHAYPSVQVCQRKCNGGCRITTVLRELEEQVRQGYETSLKHAVGTRESNHHDVHIAYARLLFFIQLLSIFIHV